MKIYLNTDGKGAGGPQHWAARFIADLQRRGYTVTHDVSEHFDAAYINISSAAVETLLEKKIPFAYRVDGCHIPEWFDVMGSKMEEQHHLLNESIRRALELSPKVIYQSEWSKSQLDRLLHKREHDFAIIHNGVPSDLFRPSKKTDAEIVIASAGALRYRFRLWTLFQLSRELERSHSLVIAGSLDNESRAVLDEYRKDPVIGARVRYAGDLSEAEWAGALSRCDILFHPVCGDSCPNVVAEALMCGVPVVAPQFGGTSELMGNGGVAFECLRWRYFEPAFTQNATDACRRVLDNLRKFKSQARLHAEQHLSLEKMTDRYLEQLDLPKRVSIHVRVSARIKSGLRAFLR